MTTFNQWLESGTIKRGTVDLYGDTAMMGDLEALSAKIAKVEADEKEDRESGEWTASRKSKLPALEAEAEALMAKYDESKMVVHLRALTQGERDAVLDEVPDPEAPVIPRQVNGMTKEAFEVAKREFEKRLPKYKRETANNEAERRIRLLAVAIEKVTVGGEDADAPTIDDLRALRAAQYGNERIDMLWAEVSRLSKMGEAPDPFSRRDSETTPD